MEDTPAYRLDIESLKEESHGSDPAESGDGQRRPWVGIRFECCGIYTRIYRNPEATAYTGQCPRCGKKVRLKVGDGGTDSRFFVAE